MKNPLFIWRLFSQMFPVVCDFCGKTIKDREDFLEKDGFYFHKYHPRKHIRNILVIKLLEK